jgi:hypothetical protein
MNATIDLKVQEELEVAECSGSSPVSRNDKNLAECKEQPLPLAIFCVSTSSLMVAELESQNL